MANSWFSDFTRLVKGTKARADAPNALFDQIEAGMDKMPTEEQLNRGTRNYAADTGSVNAYACALTHISTAYEIGQVVDLLIDAADISTSTTVTLNVSAIGAVSVKYPNGSDPAIGDLVGSVSFRYSGSVWHLISTSLTSVAASEASAVAAAASASAASSSASSASSSAGSASTSAGNAGTSETNAASSASAASTSAGTATTQAGNASTSETNAASSASAASTSAGNAGTSETNAASSASAASTSAGNAGTSETNAASSASAASTSAGTATTQAGNASTSASAANASAVAAAASAALNNTDSALVYRTTAQSISNDTLTVINAIDAEVYDDNSMHNPASQPQRLTVPTGVTKVIVSAHVDFAVNGTGDRLLAIRKNAAIYPGYAAQSIVPPSTLTAQLNVTTPVLEVIGGDYFDIQVYQNSGGALLTGSGSSGLWFSMQCIVN